MWDESCYVVGDVMLEVFDKGVSFEQVCRRIYSMKEIDRERFDIFMYFLYHKLGVFVIRFHILNDNELKIARLSDASFKIYVERAEKIICGDRDADGSVNHLCAGNDIIMREDSDFASTKLNDDLNSNPLYNIFCSGQGGQEEQDMNSGNDEDDNLSDWDKEALNDSNAQSRNEEEATNACIGRAVNEKAATIYQLLGMERYNFSVQRIIVQMLGKNVAI